MGKLHNQLQGGVSEQLVARGQRTGPLLLLLLLLLLLAL